MKKSDQEYEYKLDAAGVDEVSALLDDWMGRMGLDRPNRIRVRLAMEELLLRVSERLSGEITVTILLGKRLGRPCIRVRYAGERFDPTDGKESEEWPELFLANLGLTPAWRYRGGRNELQMYLPGEGHKTELMLLLSFAAAISAGAAGSLIPAGTRAFLSEYILSFLSDGFMNLLQTFAGLVIFFSVMTAICGMGSVTDFSCLGKKLLSRYVFITLLGSAVCAVVLRFFFPMESGGTSMDSSQSKQILQMVFDILPSNPVKPFYDGNTLQILFLAAFLGVLLLMLGSRTEGLQSLAVQCNVVVMRAVEIICLLLPLFIFSSLTLMFWENGMQAILRLWKPLAVCALCALCFITAELAAASIRLRVSPMLLVRKLWSAFLVGITTASSSAAIGLVLEINEKKLGIPDEINKFGVPVGNLLYSGMNAAYFLVIAYYLASVNGMQVDIVWYVVAWLLSCVLAPTVPPVSGGPLICVGVLLAQLGIPMESLAVAATLSMLFDFVETATRLCGNHLELVMLTDKLGMLDRETLEKP